MEWSYNGTTIPVLDTINQQIKSSEPGLSFFLWSCWPVSSKRPSQHYRLLPMLLFNPIELDNKTLLPKSLHSWVTEHAEIKLVCLVDGENLVNQLSLRGGAQVMGGFLDPSPQKKPCALPWCSLSVPFLQDTAVLGFLISCFMSFSLKINKTIIVVPFS